MARWARKMTCQEISDFPLEYRAGGLTADDHTAFEAHLAGCACCVEYLSSYEATVRMVRRASARDDARRARVPEALVRTLLSMRLRAQRSG